MTQDIAASMRESVDAVYRSESRRVLATLIRLLGDFDLAEKPFGAKAGGELGMQDLEGN